MANIATDYASGGLTIGKGSGSGGPITSQNIYDSFVATFGRPWTEKEAAYMNRGYASNNSVNWAADLKQKQDTLANEINKQSGAMGLTLTPQQIQEVTNAVFDPSTVQTEAQITGSDAQNLISNYVNRYANENLQKIADEKLNPTVTDANKIKAEQLLKSTFGEVIDNPTIDQDQIDFYANELAQGVKPYEIQSYIRQDPQWTELKQVKVNKGIADESVKAREAANAEMLKYEEEAFQRATPEILGSFMRAGTLSSSGLQNALAKSRADLASQRQQTLLNANINQQVAQSGYRREDLASGLASSFNQYLRQSEPGYQNRLAYNNQLLNLPQQQYQTAYQGTQGRISRQQDLEDYQNQLNELNRYISQQKSNSRSNAWMGLAGSALSGGIQGGLYGLMNSASKK